MKTICVLVTGKVTIHRQTVLLIDVEEGEDILMATERAHDRCMAGDVNWQEEPAGKINYRAVVDQSQDAEEMVTLLTDDRDRVGPLDHDEREWLDDLTAKTRIDPREIGRFNARRKA